MKEHENKHQLDERDRELIRRVFSSPLDIPNEWRSWLTAILEANPPTLPITQIYGFERYVANRGTVFPESPQDKQPFILEVSSGVSWNLRYDSSIGDSYKWVFEGGPPLQSTVSANETTASTSYADLTTTGPTVTVPKAGVYLVQYGAWAWQSGGNQVFSSLHYGTTPADGESITTHTVGAASVYRSAVITVTSDSQAVKMQYKSPSAGTANFQNRNLILTPIRIAG